MIGSVLDNLPPAPKERTGWPWSVSTYKIPDYARRSADWPRISIVTPSYNQGKFIEETIRSVLLQDYPNLEFRIADGGSTDNTVAIIKKYERYITAWSSGPDRGQVDALNRNLSTATGEILTWLNSDDLLLPGALFAVAQLYRLSSKADIISGGRIQRSAETGTEVAWIPWLDQWPRLTVGFAIFPQEATFFSRRVWEAIGGLDETLPYGFDGIFFSQALACARQIVFTASPLAIMYSHLDQKSLRSDAARLECERRVDKFYWSKVPWYLKIFARLCFTRYWIFGDSALRCLVYRRAKRKYQIGAYDWAKDQWILSAF